MNDRTARLSGGPLGTLLDLRLMLLVVLLVIATLSHATQIKIDPRNTYLRTSEDDPAPLAIAVDLGALGIHPGDLLKVTSLGDFAFHTGAVEEGQAMAAVFSSSSEILPRDELRRIPGAIDAGTDFGTPNTLHGDLPTDIPEDFFADGSTVQVPFGARFLFVTAVDVYMSDNEDRDGDYFLELQVVPGRYFWFPWTRNASTIDCDLYAYGKASLSVTGDAVRDQFPVRFEGVSFSPVEADSAEPGGRGDWHIFIDLSQVADTSKLAFGIGNFGHGVNGAPGYRLVAKDLAGRLIAPESIIQRANYDHSWLGGGGGYFDDDTLYQPSTGEFQVTTVGGGNEYNSDLAFLSLPLGVGVVETVPNADTISDTISIVLGVPVIDVQVIADSFRVALGRTTSGDLQSLRVQDGSALQVCKFLVPNQSVAPVSVEVEGIVPAGTPIAIRMNSFAKLNTAGSFTQTLDLYDWQAGSFSTVDTKTESLSTTYHAMSLDANLSNVARYVRAGDGRVRGRYRLRQTGPVAATLWCCDQDFVGWELTLGP